MRAALAHLHRARQYAQDTTSDAWDFAVEIGILAGLELSATDFRWLVRKGYVTHARDITLPGDPGRTFRPEGDLDFSRRTCFVLTEAGLCFARSVLQHDGAPPDQPAPVRQNRAGGELPSGHGEPLEVGGREAAQSLRQDRLSSGHDSALIPCWDGQLRELRCGGRLVRRFRMRSPNQETVLSAFQEEGWPHRIDDPLPPRPGQSSKRRLHDTIKSLNRHQENRLLCFVGDGTGQGIRWKLHEPANSPRQEF